MHLLPFLVPLALAQHRGFFPSDVPVQDVAPSTEQAYNTAAATGSWGVRIEMEVSRDKGAFRRVPLETPVCSFDPMTGKGDHVALRFVPTAAGFIHILNHAPPSREAPNGIWSLIYPAPERAWEDHSFAPNQPARFPPTEGWGFPVEGAPGRETLAIFLSPQPFSEELRKLEDRLFGKGSPGLAENSGSQNLQVSRLRSVGAAQAVHVVGKGEQVIELGLDHQARCGALP